MQFSIKSLVLSVDNTLQENTMKNIFKITDTDVIHDILDKAEYGTLALSTEDTPYAVPVNFVRIGDVIYFHGALSNRKMKMLEHNPKVSFSVVENYALIDSDFSSSDGLACPATQFFKSVSIEGFASVIENRDDKAKVFKALMQKLQPKGGYKPFSDAVYDHAIKATVVVKISVNTIACKFKFGQNLSDERFEMIVSHLAIRGTEIDRKTIEIMKKQRSPK